jgi:hypothetical protein
VAAPAKKQAAPPSVAAANATTPTRQAQQAPLTL